MSAAPVLLAAQDLRVAYGAIEAVRGIDLQVLEGEWVALIGANGAGKTSALKALCGLLPYRGRVEYLGQSTQRRGAWDLARAGLVMAPEGRGIFTRQSVEENLLLGGVALRERTQMPEQLRQAFELFPLLKERRQQWAGTLSGGEQQMLALARALMSRPRLLLLDEPSMGLAPLMVERVFAAIRTIAARGLSILLVEQNARMALSGATRAYVMESGQIVFSGSAEECRNSERVRRAYLGGD